MKRGAILLLALIILSLSFTSADFALGNKSYSINTSYSKGDFISGWLNISLENEPANSLFETSFGDEITLKDLIEKNPVFEDNSDCTPSDCTSAYSESGSGGTENSFSLDAGEEKIIGLKFTGDTIDKVFLGSFNMKISSSAGSSQNHQLEIDLFNDGEIDWESYKASDSYSSRKYGCFEVEDSTASSEITESYSCNEIRISETPRVIIGAHVEDKGGTGEVADFRLKIKAGGFDYECPSSTSITGSGLVSCIPEDFHSTKNQDILACIKAANSGTSNLQYGIKFEQTNGCLNGYDFNLYARTAEYASVGDFYFNNTERSNWGSYGGLGDIEEQIYDYLYDKYDGECPNGCIVPIKFKAVTPQDITVSEVSYRYTKDDTVTTTEHDIYDVTSSEVTYSSDFQKLYFDSANFSVPDEFGNETFSLDYKGDEIFAENIVIERIPEITSINPTTAIGGYPTDFTVNIEKFDSNESISSYSWDFGDGDTSTTQTNTEMHTYNNLGEKQLSVSITDSAGHKSSKTFTINVKTPRDALGSVLDEKISFLESTKDSIKDLTGFQQNSIKKKLNLTSIEDSINSIKQRNASANTDEDFVNIMKDLIKIRVPLGIKSSFDASVTSLPEKRDIDVEVVSKFTGESFDSSLEGEYIDGILGWNIENARMKINQKRFSAVYGENEEDLVSVFELELDDNSGRGKSLLIIPKLRNMEFNKDYSQRDEDGYYAIPITGDSESISFSTTEDVQFNELSAFAAPSLNSLQITRQAPEKEDSSIWWIYGAILFFLVAGALIIYVLLQEWYKKKYENYLFDDKNDLYNMVSYIQSSKKKGLKNREIESNLKKSGWSGEQVKYVMKKYAGKKTGMLVEIPVDKLLGLFSKKEKMPGPQGRKFPPKRY